MTNGAEGVEVPDLLGMSGCGLDDAGTSFPTTVITVTAGELSRGEASRSKSVEV